MPFGKDWRSTCVWPSANERPCGRCLRKQLPEEQLHGVMSFLVARRARKYTTHHPPPSRGTMPCSRRAFSENILFRLLFAIR